MPRRASSASPYLTTSVLPLSQLKTWGCCPKVSVEQGELLQFRSLHKAAERDQGLVYLPLFTPTPTTNIPLHPALTHHSRSAARCFVLHALHPARLTLGYSSLLPCIHPLGAALALSPRTSRPLAPAEARGAGDDWSREQYVANHGLLPTQ